MLGLLLQDVRRSARRSIAALSLLVAFASPAAAQAYLPSMKIGTAALLTPGAADAYYGSATASTTTLTARQPELVALSRALKGDPDLIYQYVHDNIQTVWEYGLQKGALGASIDKSGTAFDQAMLMVELLRQAGFTATYEVGTITLSGAQFAAWSNVADATAACQLLSGGAIPAIINGTTSATCAYGTGTAISTVTLSHAWVKVSIPGSACAANCLFDPAYKGYTWLAGIDLAAATGLTAGAPLAQATGTGYTAGTDPTLSVPYAKSFTAGALNTLLTGYSTSLLSYMQTNNLNGQQLEGLISGGVIVPASTAAPLRQAALPYASSALHEWTGNVPDQYRTVLHLTVTMRNPNTGLIEALFSNVIFFADETYGRRLTIATNFTNGDITSYASYGTYTTRLKLDDQLKSSHTMSNVFPDEHDPATVTLSLDHPYAAASGSYMDATVTKIAILITPMSIVLGLGDTGPALLAKWSGERVGDTQGPNRVSPIPNCEADCTLYNLPSTGDYAREKAQANFLAEYTRAAHMHAAIAGGIVQTHHVLGLVYADDLADDNNQDRLDSKPDYWVADSAMRIDVDTGLSFASRTANAPARRAAIQAIAATSGALEGSVVAQMQDSPDSSSTATRFEWGNAPPCDSLTANLWHCEDPSQGGPRKFLTFSAAAPPPASGDWALWENNATIPAPPVSNDANGAPQTWGTEERSVLEGFVSQYVAAGFSVTASQESFLGPGQRGGYIKVNPAPHGSPGYNYAWTKQRGGAFVATRYDANGDPVEIAHDVVGLIAVDSSGTVLPGKGGGGGSEPDNASTYNPAEAADVMKSLFADRSNALGVDLANGSMGHDGPSLGVGNGGFPYALSAGYSFKQGVGVGVTAPGRLRPEGPAGWVHSWYNALGISGSGMEGMGASDVRAAAATIAAFLAEQDVYKAAPGTGRDVAAVLTQAWLMRQYQGNVVTATVGTGVRQFVRLPDGSWIAPGASQAALSVTASTPRQPFTFVCPAPFANSGAQYALARGWDDSGLGFTVTNAHGDQEHFGYWQERDDATGLSANACNRAAGFRLDGWSFPQGITVALAYNTGVNNQSTIFFGSDGANQSSSPNAAIAYPTGTIIQTVSNGLHTLRYDYSAGVAIADETGRTLAFDGSTFTDPLGIAYGFDFGPEQFASPTQRPVPYQPLTQVGTPYLAAGPNPGTLDLQYDYDALGQVMAVHDAVNLQVGDHSVPGGRDPYVFRIADHTRGERDDPDGAPYTVVYDTYGHPRRYTDELGRTTASLFDSRGRVVSYTYPEGDQERFAYDDHDNTTLYTRVAKPGSSLANLAISATYDPTWNKPLTLTNARGQTTTFGYYASGAGASLMHTAVRPADGNGHGPAAYSFTYTAIGRPLTSTDPDGVATTNGYDTSGNLTSTTLDPGTGHINSTTSYTYDTVGNVASTTDPNGFTTTSLYDLDRRKTEDDHHNGNATAALVAASQSVYDVLGRVTDTKAGTAFSGTAVTTWLTTAHTTYTPTSKPATVTDADTSVTTTVYDDLDRVLTVTDPVGRAIHDAYDAAGQLITEYRGWGSRLSQAYATHSYSLNGKETSVLDADGGAHLTTYAYDGFDRLAKTAYADGSHEDLAYDANSNILSRRTRAGPSLTYAYDNLDRLTVKTVPWWGGVAGHAVGTAYSLAGRVTGESDSAGPGLSYSFDTAGRATAELQLTNGTSRTVTWTLDAMGNHTRLTWPDAYAVDYTFDALNRMSTVAVHSSGANLATYTYDPLSRRTGVAYNGGTSSMAYTWSNAGDLLTLTDNLAGTANDVTFTDTYTAAHQLAGETTSNSAYLWTPPPPTGHDTYATVNNLNQYPSVNGGALTWDANGNLATMAGATYAHDPENRLIAVSGTTPASYTYDPLNRRVAKALDTHAGPQWGSATWGSFTWTANPSTTVLHDGDSEIAEYDNSGALTRRFVPGAAIDEPVAMITAAGAASFFHTDRKGSVIAMADTSGNRVEGPYTYDSYGNCFVGATTTSCTTLAATTEPYRYTGQRYDAETGLYYYRARYYCVMIGRFCETDPAGYKPDVNWYSYTGNDPTDKTDSTGQGVDDVVWVGVGIGLVIVATGNAIQHEWQRSGIPEKIQHWMNNEDAPAPDKKTGPQVHPGKQGKHQPGHPNFDPARGRSEVTHPDPQGLVDSHAGTGEQAGDKPVGEPGSKERVDFGEPIGTHVDQATGERTPTTVGTIHYGKNDVHVVPARPSAPTKSCDKGNNDGCP